MYTTRKMHSNGLLFKSFQTSVAMRASQAYRRRFNVCLGLNILDCKLLTCQRVPLGFFGNVRLFSNVLATNFVIFCFFFIKIEAFLEAASCIRYF